MKNGEEEDLLGEEGRLAVSPSLRIRGRYRLEDLVARMPADYAPAEEDWGRPMGREAW